jgi:hypothetical protein
MMILYLVLFQSRTELRNMAVVTVDRSFEVERGGRKPTPLELANSAYNALANHLDYKEGETKLSLAWRLLRADRLEIEMDMRKNTGGTTTCKTFF